MFKKLEEVLKSCNGSVEVKEHFFPDGDQICLHTCLFALSKPDSIWLTYTTPKALAYLAMELASIQSNMQTVPEAFVMS